MAGHRHRNRNRQRTRMTDPSGPAPPKPNQQKCRSVRASCAHAQTVTPRARAHEPQRVRNTHTERGSEACPNHALTPTSAPIPRAPPVCPSRAHPPALLKVPQRARTLAMVCQTESRHPLASCITRHFQIGIGRPRRQKRVSGRRWFERLVIGLKETVKVKRHALRARERHTPEVALSSDVIASNKLDGQLDLARVASTLRSSGKGRSAR